MSKVVLLNYENVHDYTLIGIHTPIEDYRLAFLLNKAINIKLKREKKDLDFDTSFYTHYNYKCAKTFTNWSLIANKYVHISTKTPSGLFSDNYSTTILIKEKKQVDYFLKIDTDLSEQNLNKTITKINTIKNIITSYTIDPLTLKSKDFLIF